MLKKVLVTGCLTLISVAFVAGQAPRPQQAPAAPTAAPAFATPDVSKQRALLDQYCVVCHNQKLKTANLLLDQLDLAHIGERPEIGEKVVRKLRAGMMPPSGMPRPDFATRESLITWMEKELDGHSSTYLPAPGIHRLNRVEYNNVVRDLLGLEASTSSPSRSRTTRRTGSITSPAR